MWRVLLTQVNFFCKHELNGLVSAGFALLVFRKAWVSVKVWSTTVFLHWRPFCSLCLHQRLEACRRSRRPLYRRSAEKGLLFAFHRKFSFQWLISRIFQAISSISGLHFHRGELQTLGSVVEKSLLFLRKMLRKEIRNLKSLQILLECSLCVLCLILVARCGWQTQPYLINMQDDTWLLQKLIFFWTACTFRTL